MQSGRLSLHEPRLQHGVLAVSSCRLTSGIRTGCTALAEAPGRLVFILVPQTVYSSLPLRAVKALPGLALAGTAVVAPSGWAGHREALRLYAASPPSASPDASRIEASFWRWLPACMPSFFNTRRCLIPTACQMPKSSEPTPTGGSCLSKRQAIVRVLSNAARPCKKSWQGCCGLPDPRLSGKGGWS